MPSHRAEDSVNRVSSRSTTVKVWRLQTFPCKPHEIAQRESPHFTNDLPAKQLLLFGGRSGGKGKTGPRFSVQGGSAGCARPNSGIAKLNRTKRGATVRRVALSSRSSTAKTISYCPGSSINEGLIQPIVSEPVGGEEGKRLVAGL